MLCSGFGAADEEFAPLRRKKKSKKSKKKKKHAAQDAEPCLAATPTRLLMARRAYAELTATASGPADRTLVHCAAPGAALPLLQHSRTVLKQ